MDIVRSVYDWTFQKLPKPKPPHWRRLWMPWGRHAGQAVLSTKTAVTSVLCATCSLNTGPEAASELSYYGRSPPVYPSQLTLSFWEAIGNGTTNAQWAAAYRAARALVSEMTVDELVNITRGFPGPCAGNTGEIPRLGIPSLCFADGPAGIRGQEFVSAFPAGIHLAATWDRELMYQYGRALGREFYGRGINVALGPVAGPLGRVVRGGRNWEGLSNDPYLAGVAMGLVTRGMQDAGVIATPKHWLLNEQEYRRRWVAGEGHAVSSNVGDRTLHELYAFPFMDALREGAGAVMCSYQRANHSYACQNSKLLNGVLKTELGFEGFVVSDWDGQMSGVASANAGLDLVMPGAGFWGEQLAQAVRNGSVAHDRLRDMATRILASWHYLQQEHSFPSKAVYTNLDRHPPIDVQEDHAALIRTIGAAGTVLVKNLNHTLPLRKPRFLCVFGYDATVNPAPWNNRDRYGGGYDVNHGWNTFLNGTLITGGGSGGVTPPYVVSPFQALQERAAKDRAVLRWDFVSDSPTPYPNAEVCLVFLNAYASESFDRPGLRDEWGDRLVSNVAGWCKRTVVVVHSAGVRVVDPWVEHENVTAVVMAGLPGQESGHALVDVLYGEVNPAGKLVYTVAKSEEAYGPLLNSSVPGPDDNPIFPNSDFEEGLFIDYRYFDKLHPRQSRSCSHPPAGELKNKNDDDDDDDPVRFEFGFGLSYTSFSYTNLSISLLTPSPPAEYPDPSIPIIQGGHAQLWEDIALVKCNIQNTGDAEGAEVVQVYIGVPGSGITKVTGDDDTEREGEEDEVWDDAAPVRVLRGFEKVGPLAPGQVREVGMVLRRRDLSVWDVVAQQWRLRRGVYKVWVGASSRDLRLEGRLVI